MANLPEDLRFPIETVIRLDRQSDVCRTILYGLYERMVDVYDGAPDSTNHLPFTGGDIRDIEEVLR